MPDQTKDEQNGNIKKNQCRNAEIFLIIKPSETIS